MRATGQFVDQTGSFLTQWDFPVFDKPGKMTFKARRVAVVGAGPSGAIAVDALVKEQAFDTIRVFDRRAAIGGTWNYTPHLPSKIPSLRDLLNNAVDEAPPIPEVLPAVTPISEAVNSYQIRFSDTAIRG